MERKIGEIFEYNGEWYQCVQDNKDCCECCDFTEYCKSYTGYCDSAYREDGESICFKKLEKVGEPFLDKGKLFQKYKVFDIDNANARSDVNVFMPVDNNMKIVLIEIKQNKEDMEEKIQLPKKDTPLTRLVYEYVNGKISDKDLIESIKELPDKYPYTANLKKFDLEAAKAGKPVCTRDGRKARIICFDLKNEEYPIVAAIENDSSETLLSYTINGEIIEGNYKSDKDLMMLPEKHEGWVNIIRGDNGKPLMGRTISETEEKAKCVINPAMDKIIATIKINWEE